MFWRSRDRLIAKLDEIRQSLPKGIEIVATYDRSAWIWTTLKEFFATLVTELDRPDSGDGAVSGQSPDRGRSDRDSYC